MRALFFLLLFVTHAVVLGFLLKDLLFRKDFCDVLGYFGGVWFGF